MEELGTIRPFTAKLHVSLQDNPTFYKHRTVPYALGNATDDELNCLEHEVKLYVLKGWPKKVPQSLNVYHSKIEELKVEDGCLLWGGRVIIPQSVQEVMKAELHREHSGISKMKALARGHGWWPGINEELTKLVKSCS